MGAAEAETAPESNGGGERDGLDAEPCAEVPALAELITSLLGRDVDLSNAVLWPPDVFALCAVVLEETGAYRLAVDPPAGQCWPPEGDWAADITERATAWSGAVDRWWLDHEGSDPYSLDEGVEKDFPTLFAKWSSRMETPVDQLSEDWEFIAAVLDSLALADEASAGMGLPGGTLLDGIDLQAVRLLEASGTCSCLPARRVRVLPKMRTPQCGIGVRSLSMNLSLVRGEVDVRWSQLPTALDLKKLEILLLPWPMEITDSDFRESEGNFCGVDAANFGFFAFEPKWEPRAERVVELVKESRQICGGPDLVVFPEASLSRDDLEQIQRAVFKALGAHSPAILAGVRGVDSGGRDENLASLSWVPPDTSAWTEVLQPKHHRWYLDERQIKTYQLGGSLHPSRKWWEGITIPKRRIGFFAMADWLVFCPLVCEDLARQDPVSPVVRAVAPSLVVALLLDGPQVEQRWSGRYASVLADDPGTSVLAVSSFGMVRRSKTPGYDPSVVVGLWKDPINGVRTVCLDQPGDGILMTVGVRWETEWTADGRTDGGRAAVPVLEDCRVLGAPTPKP